MCVYAHRNRKVHAFIIYMCECGTDIPFFPPFIPNQPLPWLIEPWPWLYLSTAMVTLPCAHEFIICPCVDIVGWLMSCLLSFYTTHSKPHHHLHPLRPLPRKATAVLFLGLSLEIIVLLENVWLTKRNCFYCSVYLDYITILVWFTGNPVWNSLLHLLSK